MRKGQIGTTDLFLAIILLIALVTIFFITWNMYHSRLSDVIPRNEMELYTIQLTNQLVRSSGIPDNWESNISSIQAIGLADTDRVISEEKLQAFISLDYNATRELLNIGSYEFYFLLLKENETITEIGSYPSGQSVKLRRNVIYQDETSTIEVALWK